MSPYRVAGTRRESTNPTMGLLARARVWACRIGWHKSRWLETPLGVNEFMHADLSAFLAARAAWSGPSTATSCGTGGWE